MRENKTIKFAILLLALALLTSYVVGGTFAKYVTSREGTDTARVAKFGVTISAEGATFAKQYAKDESAYTETNTVVSTDKVVAPGTKGNLATATISGTPEVAVRVSQVAELTLEGWKDSSDGYYCPIEIKVGETTLKGTSYTSISEFKTAVEEAIKEYTDDYPAGTNLSTATNSLASISWAWAFTGNDDAKDTYLGNQAAAENASTIALKVTTTVTQID